MSSPCDLETEVNEKLLNNPPYSSQQVNNNKDPSHHPNHSYHQPKKPHLNNGKPSNGKPPSNSSHGNSGNNHYQPTRSTANTSNNQAVMGSSEIKVVTPYHNNKYELERRLNHMKWYLCSLTLGFIIAIVIIIITFAVLIVKMRHDLDNHTHKPKVGEQVAVLLQHESLCVPCSEYRLGPSPEEERMLNTFSLKDSDKGLTCCVDTPQELLDLLKMFVERRFRQEMAKGIINRWPKSYLGSESGNRQPIAAHLMMTTQDMEGVSRIRGRQYPIGRWIHENDMAFTIGTSYQHGRIVIPTDGFYFVYSQISFMEYYTLKQKEAFDSRTGADSPSLSHYLYRYNIHYHNGGEEKLAQNSITKCWGQSRQYGEYTSYLGAVFFLRNSDEIFIKVSNITMISTDPKLSYFGLFRI